MVWKSDFQKVKTEQIRAFVPEESQSVERQDVLRTASESTPGNRLFGSAVSHCPLSKS